MLANYGYKDASGDFFITIDTEKCNGCGECIKVCPSSIFAVVNEDPNEPMRDGPVAIVLGDKKKKLKYECNPCKHAAGSLPFPCVEACEAGAILHSW